MNRIPENSEGPVTLSDIGNVNNNLRTFGSKTMSIGSSLCKQNMESIGLSESRRALFSSQSYSKLTGGCSDIKGELLKTSQSKSTKSLAILGSSSPVVKSETPSPFCSPSFNTDGSNCKVRLDFNSESIDDQWCSEVDSSSKKVNKVASSLSHLPGTDRVTASKPSTPTLIRIPEENFDRDIFATYNRLETPPDLLGDCFRTSSTRDYLMGYNFTEENEQEVGDFLNMGYKFCAKHPKKLAKYYIQNDKDHKFCSKCALTFAMNGHPVLKEIPNEEMFKKEETEKFLKELGNLKLECKTAEDQIDAKRRVCEKFHSAQNDKIIEVFACMEQVLISERSNYLAQIKNSFDRIDTSLEKNLHQVRLFNEEIGRFHSDVHQNFSNIITRMELSPFLEIMQKYSKRLTEIRGELSKSDIDCRRPDFLCLREDLSKITAMRHCVRECLSLTSLSANTQENYQGSMFANANLANCGVGVANPMDLRKEELNEKENSDHKWENPPRDSKCVIESQRDLREEAKAANNYERGKNRFIDENKILISRQNLKKSLERKNLTVKQTKLIVVDKSGSQTERGGAFRKPKDINIPGSCYTEGSPINSVYTQVLGATSQSVKNIFDKGVLEIPETREKLIRSSQAIHQGTKFVDDINKPGGKETSANSKRINSSAANFRKN